MGCSLSLAGERGNPPVNAISLKRPNWFWETGNGELGNNNIHMVDVCRWGLGVTGLGRAVLSMGGRLSYVAQFSDEASDNEEERSARRLGGRRLLWKRQLLQRTSFTKLRP